MVSFRELGCSICSRGPEPSIRAGLEKLMAVAFETTGDESRGEYDELTASSIAADFSSTGKGAGSEEEKEEELSPESWGIPGGNNEG